MKWLFAMLILVIMAYCNPCWAEEPCSAETKEVVIEKDPQFMETNYSMSDDTCTVRWTVYESELNRGVVQNRSKCDLALKPQLPLLSKILGEILKDEKNARLFDTLFWGRLMPDGRKHNFEMSFRLAKAAYESSKWDLKRGRAKTGHENQLVETLANEVPIYIELEELFEQFNRRIVFSSAEKVLIVEAEKLLFFDQLKRLGVEPTDRLPYDCLTWFSVSEIKEN